MAAFLLLMVAPPGLTQTLTLTQSVSISVTDAPLGSVLNQLEQQTGIPFAYNTKKIPVKARVTYQCSNCPLSTVLNQLSKHFHFSYKVFNKQIALVVAPNNPPLTYRLSGSVTDASNGESLIGATVWADSTNRGTNTNGYGFFTLTLPYGRHILHSSFVGYIAQTDTVFITKNTKLTIVLTPGSNALNEVVVQAPPVIVDQIQTGKVTLTPKMAGEITAALGESDVLKSLALLPGIKLQSEGSTFFYVRGGNKDQNLLLLDDAPIYNPTHMFGLISTLIPETTNAVEVYKSDFPLSKGGRLSSVIDIKSKEGNKHTFSGWGNLGLVSTQLGIEGPLKKGASSFRLTGRFSRIKWFLAREINNLEKANFYDLTGKFNIQLNKSNQLYASFYTGSDKFLTPTNGLEWANFNGSLRWSKKSAHLFSNTTLYGSNYEYLFHYNRAQQTSWRSRIGELGLKTDITHFFNEKHSLAYGGSLTGRTMNPGNLTGLDSLPDALIVSVKNNIELAAYAQYRYRPSKKWGFKAGLRATAWNSLGEAFEFTFNNLGQPIDTTTYKNGEIYHSLFTLEPHANISYFITENSAVKLSFDRTTQNLHLISSSISPFTSFEVWLPSGPNIKPQKANQWSAGYYHYMPALRIALQAEPYVKWMFNQVDYQSHPGTLLNPTLENQLVFGTTQTWGLEVQAKKETGKWRGIVGYTYAKAISSFGNLNNGQPFVANTDRPHYASATLQFNARPRVMLSTNFIYTSGTPFSSPTSFYLFNGNEVPVYKSKNNSRMPAYHRLDVAAKFILNKNPQSKFKHSLTLSVYNVYGRKNPVFINFNKIESQGKFKVPGNVLTATRLTTRQYVFGVAPAINYQFRF